MIQARLKKVVIAALAGVLILTGAAAAQQYKGLPVTKDRLLMALKTKALQTRQIVQTINTNGVDFQLTAAIESELVAAGARPEVLSAARNNYRAPAGGRRPVTNEVNKGNGAETGGAVSKAALVKTLRTKSMSNGAILDMIENNGVNFETTPAVERELAAAGASPAIIAAVKSAYRGEIAYEQPVRSNAASSYEDLLVQAIETYNRDVNSNMPANSPGRLAAIQLLNRAITIEKNNPMAYQQLGFMTLYGTINGFTAAENNFRTAIGLGGSAVFRVYHDHDGVFNDVCSGSLYVSRDGVRFESDDNRHTFDTIDANIKQVKTNSSWRRAFQIRKGSFKIVLTDENDDDGVKFSFAPLTDNIEESKMVIRLIGKN